MTIVKKPEAKPPEKPVPKQESKVIALDPSEVQTFREILKIAEAGIPSTSVSVLVNKLEKVLG
jgi:hypothetical protein